MKVRRIIVLVSALLMLMGIGAVTSAPVMASWPATEMAEVVGSPYRADFERYCRDRGRDYQVHSNTAYGGSCSGQGIYVAEICRQKFGGNTLDRLKQWDTVPENAFECFRGTSLGGADFGRYCGNGGAELRGRTVNDWHCRQNGQRIGYENFTVACQRTYDRWEAISRIGNWNNPYSVVCYG